MTDTDVAAYKEQVFGNGQSSTHAPTPNPTNDTLSAEPKLADTVSQKDETNVAPKNDAPTNLQPEEKIVDADTYLTEQLGVKSWEEAKAALAELSQLKEAAKTPFELKFANDQSRALHEAILAGKTDDVYEILDTQRKVSAVSSMKPAEAIKLHIQQTNKSFKSIDVEDVFEEKYAYPEKPEQRTEELDNEFEAREEKWKAAKEKIDRRIERDAATAKTELSKLSAELKIPEIPKPIVNEPDNQVDTKELERLDMETKAAYSKLSPKDIQMVFKFNDEASKLAFDIVYEPEKETFDESVSLASDMNAYFSTYHDKDGSPKRVEFLKDLYAGRNIQKIVSEAIVQAVNQERIRALKFQKNIGDGTQRSFVYQPPSDIDKLKQQVFGK